MSTGQRERGGVFDCLLWRLNESVDTGACRAPAKSPVAKVKSALTPPAAAVPSAPAVAAPPPISVTPLSDGGAGLAVQGTLSGDLSEEGSVSSAAESF